MTSFSNQLEILGLLETFDVFVICIFSPPSLHPLDHTMNRFNEKITAGLIDDETNS